MEIVVLRLRQSVLMSGSTDFSPTLSTKNSMDTMHCIHRCRRKATFITVKAVLICGTAQSGNRRSVLAVVGDSLCFFPDTALRWNMTRGVFSGRLPAITRFQDGSRPNTHDEIAWI